MDELKRTSRRSAYCARAGRRKASATGLIAALLTLLLPMVACDDGPVRPSGPRCEEVPISKNLQEVFYWGDDDGYGTWVVNGGRYEMWGVRAPEWVDANHILVATETLIDDHGVHAVALIELDPVTSGYVTHTLFTYKVAIFQIRVIDVDHLFVLAQSSGEFFVARVAFSGTSLQDLGEVVPRGWSPNGIETWGGHPGVVFEGINPADGVPGIYWSHYSGGSWEDSLLCEVPPDPAVPGTIAMDSQGNAVYFTTFDGVQGTVYRKDLTDPASHPMALYSRRKYIVSLDVSPKDPSVLLSTYVGHSRDALGSIVEIVGPPYTSSTAVDTRTIGWSCLTPTSGLAAWDSSGTRFAFPGGATSGEGDYHVEKLWIARNVPIEP